MNEQVAELIQQMKDEHGDKWAQEFLYQCEVLGNQTSNDDEYQDGGYQAYCALSDWIENAINAHDALTEALETLVAYVENRKGHAKPYAPAMNRARAALAKAKGEA